ncbi:SDR family NAD(P)-dependent oxidoreductase [Aurantiacibacter poecillastricola]|uniref:SDR family NAD(P)-dependent oxidoreductase n=1 Tax=Aurantiacibacter poecillastricola TaxID=3064385 RepID=UPI00273F96B6|nr:SDR family NAD(P)-dependent oxidoreductase [Aurantiacibacter sp. 219JJ12-13]MDP5261859.1 SDR family NAD(P)-dependent oxidoreductase [Aurantiacibacter sp. 219JJ12-13]
MSENTSEKPLAGKIALVTGASRGIGAATAKALAARGAHVVLVARKVKDLEGVEDAIHDEDGTATIAPLDLTDGESIGRLAQAIAERWDKLDILVIAAAQLPTLTPVTQIDQKQFNEALTLNVLATQALLAAFDPLLKRSDNGRIVALTSSVGSEPRPFWGAYGASKAAFDNLVESHAKEVERISETRLAIIDPGATRTAMRERAYPGEDPQSVKPPEVVGDRIAELLVSDFPNLHRERVETPR